MTNAISRIALHFRLDTAQNRASESKNTQNSAVSPTVMNSANNIANTTHQPGYVKKRHPSGVTGMLKQSMTFVSNLFKRPRFS